MSFAERAALAAEADARLRTLRDPDREKANREFFPSALEHLGVELPAVRRIDRELRRRLKRAEGAEVIELALSLHEQGTFEGRLLAYMIVNGSPQAMDRLGLATLEALGAGLDNSIVTNMFGTDLAAPLWQADVLADGDLRRWARSTDPWWRRAALLAGAALHLPSRGGLGGATGIRRTLDLVERLLDDREVPVKKGLSFALCSLVRTSPPAVRAFLEEQGERVPAPVRREVGARLAQGPRPVPSARRKKA